ncbi:MAG: hypothetical protein KY458_07520 [Actinobacteria bacterium]|nr:hypothetical protein [Actinomycetota bacterium]
MATHITVDIAAVAELAARLRALAGSGRDVVFDVIGLATLGLSRAFGAAARVGRMGSTGAAAAASTVATSGDEAAGAATRLVAGADDAAGAAGATRRVDYGADFVEDISKFEPGSASFPAGPLDDELVLVQYFDEAGDGSGKWWTSLDEANRMSTTDDVHQRLALLPEWGSENAVRVLRIPPGEDVAFLYGRARPQVGTTGPARGQWFAGGGEQFRLPRVRRGLGRGQPGDPVTGPEYRGGEQVDWAAITKGPAPEEYLRLCDRAIEVAEALRRRRQARGEQRGAELAARAVSLLEAGRAGSAEHGVPSGEHGIGFAMAGFISEYDWGPEGRDLVDAVYAMADYWRRHL